MTWGQTGPPGPAGTQGPAGAIDVRYRNFRAAPAGDPAGFKSFTVPAGSWVILAKATVDAQETVGASCYLSGPGGGDEQTVRNFVWGPDSRAISPFHSSAVSLQLAGTVAAETKVTFGCASINAPASVRDVRVLAVPVSSVDSSIEQDPLTVKKIRARLRATRVRFARSAP